MKVVIIGGGDQDPAFIRSRIEVRPRPYIIAADRGIEGLSAIGERPDELLGDFDSALRDDVEMSRKRGEIEAVYPSEKNFTDTEAAIDRALQLKADEIELLAVTGGRLDHFLAVVQNLLIPLAKGVPAVIADPQNRIFLADRSFTLRRDEAFGKYFSLIPMTDTVRQVTLRGFKYPLEGAFVKRGRSLCISNEITADTAEVSFEDGLFAVVMSRDRN